MTHRLALCLSFVPFMLACSPSSPSQATAEGPRGTEFLAQSSTRFAARVAHSQRAAALRAPWVNAALASPPAATVPSPEIPSSVYPAFKPNAPQIVDQGAPTLSSMKIVTLTWGNDPYAGALEAFGDGIGSTAYWSSIQEYGIGPASSGPARHYRGTSFPATITDVQIDALVQASVGNPASGWPANAEQQIYALYLPATTTFLVDNGDGTTTPACQILGGYHTATQPIGPDGGPSGRSIIYSVIPRCPGFGFDFITYASSHEFGEAASDSFATGGPAYLGFDPDHLAYDIYQSFQDEIGDACEFFSETPFEAPPPFTFNVTRLWSNQSARAGHNPCVPLINGEAYYNTTTFPEQLDTIAVDFTPISPPGACTPATCTTTAKGIKVPLGKERSFDIGFYSDAPTGEWTVQAFALPTLPISDASGHPVVNGSGQVTVEKPTGRNGHKAHVTVKPVTSGGLGVQYIELQSGYGQLSEAHTLPILISQR